MNNNSKIDNLQSFFRGILPLSLNVGMTLMFLTSDMFQPSAIPTRIKHRALIHNNF